jgi:hypothetical protein
MMALSTAVMSFDLLFLKFSCVTPIRRDDRRRPRASNKVNATTRSARHLSRIEGWKLDSSK